MKKRFLSIVLVAFFGLSLFIGCGSTEETVETVETEEEEEVVEKEAEPIYPTEDDVDIFVYGLKDYTILQGTTSFDVASLMMMDVNIVDGIYIDESAVDFATVGEYEVTYTVFFNEENLKTYIENIASYEADFDVVVVLDENGDIISEDAEETSDTENEENPYAITVTKTYTIVAEDEAAVLVEDTIIYMDDNAEYNSDEVEVEEDTTDTENANTDSSSSSSSSKKSTNSGTSSSASSSSGTSNSSSSSSSNSSSSTTTTTTTCNHNWVEQTTTEHHDATGHYENVCVQEAYDEYVLTGYEGHYICHLCGVEFIGYEAYEAHCEAAEAAATTREELANSCALAGWWGYDKPVYSIVHHDAVYEDKWIQDSAAYDITTTSYKCSKCGTTRLTP